MANNNTLKSDIRQYIYSNQNEEITGNILRDVLLEMVDSLGDGWTYKGVATTSTNPGTPDDNVFYIATAPGTYTNFGGLSVVDGEVAILKYNGSWTKEVTGAATAAQVTQLGQDVEDNTENINALQAEIDAIQPIVIEGNVTNAPDEEDITADENDLLKFKDRTQAVNQMGYVILRKDNTFASQVTATNTIYEIRYAFDLGGGEVTIPDGCVLKFDGGELTNGTIVGTNTGIHAGLVKIFGTDIILSGSFDIDKWECAWFGAVNDGQMVTAAGSPASFSGTDNFDAIQCTIYNALHTNVRRIHLHQGNFRLTNPLFLGLEEYNNCIFFGDGLTLVREGGNAATKGTALFFDTPIGGIFVNSSRGTTISDLGIYGLNHYFAGNLGHTNMSSDPATWFYTTIENHYGLYCAGISIDAICSNSSFVPFTDKYGMDVTPSSVKYSSYVQIKNCTISGFASGLDLQTTSANAGNCDFIYCNRVDFSYCVYGCRNYANQCRLLNFDYCRFSAMNTGVVNHDTAHSRYGNMGGKFTLCEWGYVYQFFELADNPPVFDQCSGENNYRLGKYTNSANTAPILFLGGRYSFRQSASNTALGIIPIAESTLSLYEWAVMVNTLWGTATDVGKNLVLPNMLVYGANMSSSQRIIPIPLAVNGLQISPEFLVQKVPTNVSGLQMTLAATLPNVKVGDYLVDIATNGVFEVKANAGSSLTIEALTFIKGSAINTDLFDVTRNINWYKINKPYGQLTKQNGMSIIRSALPTTTESFTKGMWIYSVPQLKPAWWNGSKWVDAKGFAIARTVGTTAQRPTLTASDNGYPYFDTTLKKPIWWNGSAWVDATGTSA